MKVGADLWGLNFNYIKPVYYFCTFRVNLDPWKIKFISRKMYEKTLNVILFELNRWNLGKTDKKKLLNILKNRDLKKLLL